MKRNKYIIGIDGGTQSTKVSIFDVKGNPINSAQKQLKPLYTPDINIAEHPDDDLWETLKVVCKKVLDEFGGNTEDIIGVGLGSIRFCKVLLNSEGELVHPVINWMDKRVSQPIKKSEINYDYITTATGYLTIKLTNQFNDTIANYQGFWPIDSDEWSWSGSFSDYGFNKNNLFDLKMPGELLGYVTNQASIETSLPKGIPVIATANDKAVEALGSGLNNDNTILISLGTYITAMIQSSSNEKNSNYFWTNFASIPYQYLYESDGIRKGMWTISWFKNLISNEEFADDTESQIEDKLNEMAENVPVGSDGLLVIPDWLSDTEHSYRKGTILGFDQRHGKGHIYRSILESIAMTMKNKVDEMTSTLRITPTKLILSGGGSNSEVFVQIFSDVFNLPSQINTINNSAGLGAAICVAVYTKEYNTFYDAMKNMTNIEKIFNPNNHNNKIYSRINENIYKKLYGYTDPLYKKIQTY
ncbi:FGGY-family carbohydrate kinase [Staphylococcus pseudoxylosus]|uniref:FGGY-family carbohydrate kinase n=1 Tax=Staphylococcus pseudoxylosus TaxID=2282419 RepID=UPI002DC03348|nr:FGGY-family carbohydrate kinase [Staphylococcus pseudoxylosus]MEB7754892.1 FGGY-family carbohydrate kinase [Staphylococcus pseudoxylosus]